MRSAVVVVVVDNDVVVEGVLDDTDMPLLSMAAAEVERM